MRQVVSQWTADRLGFTEDGPFLVFPIDLDGPPPPSSRYLDLHGGESETAWMCKHFPHLVNVDVIPSLPPTNLGHEEAERWTQGGAVAKELTPLSYFGDPANYRKWVGYERDF